MWAASGKNKISKIIATEKIFCTLQCLFKWSIIGSVLSPVDCERIGNYYGSQESISEEREGQLCNATYGIHIVGRGVGHPGGGKKKAQKMRVRSYKRNGRCQPMGIQDQYIWNIQTEVEVEYSVTDHAYDIPGHLYSFVGQTRVQKIWKVCEFFCTIQGEWLALLPSTYWPSSPPPLSLTLPFSSTTSQWTCQRTPLPCQGRFGMCPERSVQPHARLQRIHHATLTGSNIIMYRV